MGGIGTATIIISMVTVTIVVAPIFMAVVGTERIGMAVADTVRGGNRLRTFG